jgi:hypothetical protein
MSCRNIQAQPIGDVRTKWHVIYRHGVLYDATPRIYVKPARYMSRQFDNFVKKNHIYECVSGHISGMTDICLAKKHLKDEISRYMSGWSDMYLSGLTYVIYVIYLSNQNFILRQNDSLYIRMVGQISCLPNICRANHDLYRGFRFMSVNKTCITAFPVKLKLWLCRWRFDRYMSTNCAAHMNVMARYMGCHFSAKKVNGCANACQPRRMSNHLMKKAKGPLM